MSEFGKVRYANEKARIAWETAQAVDAITADLPPETAELNLVPVVFKGRARSRGLQTIIQAGTVVWTENLNIQFIPERTRGVLDRLGITYHVKEISDI